MMLDYQQIVDEIRYALQSDHCELTDDLQRAADDYSLACREANQRLKKIDSYLDKGLRSEALQLAESSPRIDEHVSILNFPELVEWNEVVGIYNLTRPEPLMVSVLDHLQEAQAIELPLQKLMASHRRLALHRAPLQVRLHILRELMHSDPETIYWEEDVRTFEQARLQEIAQEARTAHRSDNLTLLKSLNEELASHLWHDPPAPKLVSTVRSYASEVIRKNARHQLNQIAMDLESAFAELDFPKAKTLVSKWNENVKQAGSSVSQPVLDQTAPILAWVQDETSLEADEKRYQELIHQLEIDLNETSDIEDLDRTVHEIQRLNRPVPELLMIRYQNRRQALQITQGRVHRLKLTSAFAVMIAVMIGVGFLIRHQLKANEADRIARQVEGLLDQHHYVEAEKILSERDDVSQWEQLSTLQARLVKEKNEDRDRLAQFQHLMAQAREESTFPRAMTLLEQAKRYAVRADEKIQLSQLQRQREEQNHQELTDRENKVSQQIEQIHEQLRETEKAVSSNQDDENIRGLLTSAADRLSELQQLAHGLRPEFTSQIKFLETRRSELQTLQERQFSTRQKLTELTNRSGISPHDQRAAEGVDRYLTALVDYSKTVSDEQVVSLYQQRATEGDFWKGALDWSAQRRSWQQTWPSDLTELTRRIQVGRAALAASPGAPDSEKIRRYLEQLESMVSITGQLEGTGVGLQVRMQRIFSSDLVARSWCLKVNGNTPAQPQKIYYLPEQMEVNPQGPLRITYFVGYRRSDIDVQHQVRVNELASQTVTASPSQLITNDVNERLNQVRPETWNQFCLEITLRVLKDPELNACLKYDLLKRCLEISSAGDVFLKQQLGHHVRLLQDASIDPLARWMVPDDADGRKATEDATQILSHFQRLKDLEDVWKEADQQRHEFAEQLKSTTTMIGWLEPGPTWICHLSPVVPNRDCDVFVVYAPQGASSSEWRTIGRYENGEVRLRAGIQEFLAPGRPIFAVQPSR